MNAWTTSTLDAQTGTLFVSFDCPSYDFYGGDRKGPNLFGNSLVALDAATGKLKWYFQTIHHDIWDYDAPGPPTLTDMVQNGKKLRWWCYRIRPDLFLFWTGATASRFTAWKSVVSREAMCPANGIRRHSPSR